MKQWMEKWMAMNPKQKQDGKAGISDNDNDEDVKTVIEGDDKDPLKRNATEAGVGEGESNTPTKKKSIRQAKNKTGKP